MIFNYTPYPQRETTNAACTVLLCFFSSWLWGLDLTVKGRQKKKLNKPEEFKLIISILYLSDNFVTIWIWRGLRAQGGIDWVTSHTQTQTYRHSHSHRQTERERERERERENSHL